MDHHQNGASPAFIEDFLKSDMAQGALDMGYNEDLILCVITQHFRKTGRQFSTLDELVESICQAQDQGIDPNLSKEEPMDVDSDSTSPIDLDIVAEKFAGLGINDEPSKKMNPPSSTVPQIREGYGEGFLTPTDDQDYQEEEEKEDDGEEDIRQTIDLNDLQSSAFQMGDEISADDIAYQGEEEEDDEEEDIFETTAFIEHFLKSIEAQMTKRRKKTGQLLSPINERTESVLGVQGQRNDPTLSGLQAIGGQDVPSTSAMSSSIEDTSIHQMPVPSFSNMVQRAVEMGFSRDLINDVLNQLLQKTHQPTINEFIDSILDVQGQRNDPALSGLQAIGGQDVPSTSAMSSSIGDTSIHQMPVAGQLAGRSIRDELRKKMSQPSRRVPPITPIGSLRPQISVSSGHSDPDIQPCKICFYNERSILFRPCKHIVACSDCAAKVRDCPICRKPIEDYCTVFLS